MQILGFHNKVQPWGDVRTIKTKHRASFSLGFAFVLWRKLSNWDQGPITFWTKVLAVCADSVIGLFKVRSTNSKKEISNQKKIITFW